MRTPTARRLGRGLVAASGIGLAVVPWITDMHRGHTLGPGWDHHAKFHGIATVIGGSLQGALTTYLAVRAPRDEDQAVAFAAAMPLTHWLPYNVSAALPPTSVDETHRPVPRIAGVVPVNLFAQNVLAALAGVGWWVHRRGGPQLRVGPT